MIMANGRMLLVVLFIVCCFQVYVETKISPSEDDTLHFKSLQKAIGEGERHVKSPDNNLNDSEFRYDEFPSPNPQIVDLPWYSAFIFKLVMAFYIQRQNSQFGFLYFDSLANTKGHNPFPHFVPNRHGRPILDNRHALSPPNVKDYGNYIAGKPDDTHTHIHHVEENLVKHMRDLMHAYRKRNDQKKPDVIILYSWFIPCTSCTDLIISKFKTALFKNVRYKIVSYTKTESKYLRYLNRKNNERNIKRLQRNGITTWHAKISRPVENIASDEVESTNTCDMDDTFQGCMMKCLKDDFCCSCKSSKKKSMLAALVNDLTKTCAASDMNKCVGKWFQQAFSNRRSGASDCLRLNSARNMTQSCSNACSGRPMSEPLNPNFPSVKPKVLTKLSNIQDQQSVDLSSFCEDIRTEGFLCANYRSDSFTAGNTLCRRDMRCGYHKGTTYSWCYVDYDGNNEGTWDYCCTSKCGYNEEDYKWCTSGDKWQYCDDSGKW